MESNEVYIRCIIYYGWNTTLNWSYFFFLFFLLWRFFLRCPFLRVSVFIYILEMCVELYININFRSRTKRERPHKQSTTEQRESDGKQRSVDGGLIVGCEAYRNAWGQWGLTSAELNIYNCNPLLVNARAENPARYRTGMIADI